VVAAPNPSLQRTRLRSPLNSISLGGTKEAGFLHVSFVATRNASRESRIIGRVLGAGHLCAAALLTFAAASGPHDAQWELIWIPFVIADLPVSIVLYPLGIWLVGPHLGGFGPWSEPEVVIPGFIHCVAGSALYLVIPPAISAYRVLRTSRRQPSAT